MTPQEKHAKLADIARQIRKVRKAMKGMALNTKRDKVGKVFTTACRFVRLSIARAYLSSQYDLIQSQPTQ